ncbi:hypothetical protein ACQPYE_35390 [Actinosynnema sp. CA-299493]
MNHALPPTRDVPPRRRAEIRARLEREVTGGRRAARFAPLVTAGVAAAAVIALVAVVAPWQQAGGDDVAGGTDQAGATSRAAVTTTAGPPEPSPERKAEIEQGCADSAGIEGALVLRQYLADEAGAFALLYSDREVLACTVDEPTAPYSAAMVGRPAIGWLPGEFVPDYGLAVSGGDGGKPEQAGRPGYVMAAGRVTSKVARVTYGPNGQEVDATIADGTFLARIVHPSDWYPPVDWERQNVLRAYDAHGALLGTWDPGSHRTECWVSPAGEIVAGARDRDPATCAPAVAWE